MQIPTNPDRSLLHVTGRRRKTNRKLRYLTISQSDAANNVQRIRLNLSEALAVADALVDAIEAGR